MKKIVINSIYHKGMILDILSWTKSGVEKNLKILPFYEFIAMLKMKTFSDVIKLNSKYFSFET